MNNNEQFRIDTIEELEQAYEMFKGEWLEDINLENEKYDFNTITSHRWIVKDSAGEVYLSYFADYRKTIPSPLHQPQYPCEMLVSGNGERWNKLTVISYFRQMYYAVHPNSKNAIPYEFAKPLFEPVKMTKAQAVEIIQENENYTNTEIIITD